MHICSSVNSIQRAYAQSLSYWVFASQLQCNPCLSDCISMSLACKHTSETGFCACLLFRPISVMLHCSQLPISAQIDASRSGCGESKRIQFSFKPNGATYSEQHYLGYSQAQSNSRFLELFLLRNGHTFSQSVRAGAGLVLTPEGCEGRPWKSEAKKTGSWFFMVRKAWIARNGDVHFELFCFFLEVRKHRHGVA